MMLRRSIRFFSVLGLGLFCLAGCGSSGPSEPAAGGKAASADDEIVIAMLPKLTTIAYFEACHVGAEQAVEDLNKEGIKVKLIYDGPTENSGSEQTKFVETWIRQKVDAICVAPNQPKTMKRFVQKAHDAGITFLTWDSDAEESGRDLMITQVDETVLAHMLMDDLAAQMGEEGEWAIAIASLDAHNLNTWRKIAEARAADKYPKLKLVNTVVTEEDENLARQRVETLLNAHPQLKGILAFDSNSVPGAAEAIKRAGKVGEVALTGNSTPGKMKPYIDEGVLESFYLWDPRDLGNLTIRLAVAMVQGQNIEPGQEFPGHRPLVFSDKDPKTVILSDPIRFTKENIDEYDFGF